MKWRLEYQDAPLATTCGDLPEAQRWHPQWLLQVESAAVSFGLLMALLAWVTHIELLGYVAVSFSAAAVISYLLRRQWTMVADYGWLRSTLVAVSLAGLVGLQWYLAHGQWASGCFVVWFGAATLNRNLSQVIAWVTKRSGRDELADLLGDQH